MLFTPEAHEVLAVEAWSVTRVRTAVAAIVADTESAFDDGWPAHPRDCWRTRILFLTVRRLLSRALGSSRAVCQRGKCRPKRARRGAVSVRAGVPRGGRAAHGPEPGPVLIAIDRLSLLVIHFGVAVERAPAALLPPPIEPEGHEQRVERESRNDLCATVLYA
jgi:hypothetical protein